MNDPPDEREFDRFVESVEPGLRRALVAMRGVEDGRDAVAEALAWAWENWEQVTAMSNPAGYLFRVGQSRSRPRRQVLMPLESSNSRVPLVEPELERALSSLTESQRNAVILVHGCEWSYREAADALGVSKSSIGTHVARGLHRLRQHLEVESA